MLRRTTVAFLAVFGAAWSASAQTPPEAPPAAPPPAPEGPPQAPEGGPPPEYYIETPGADSAPRQTPPPPPPPGPPPRVRVYEPPPPGYGPVYEPPPPPVPRHIAPKTAFWLGARLGWFVPFGNVYAKYRPIDGYAAYVGVPWSDFASSGPMFEIDAGMRLGRNYNLFALWERAELGSGDAELRFEQEGPIVDQEGGDTDFFGIGLRATSDPNRVGFVTELALGYRRARTHFEDGSEVQFTDGILEGRLGIGVETRINPFFSLSPMATIGVGSFGDIEIARSNGRKFDFTYPNDQGDGHAWFTLQVGGHFDIATSK